MKAAVEKQQNAHLKQVKLRTIAEARQAYVSAVLAAEQRREHTFDSEWELMRERGDLSSQWLQRFAVTGAQNDLARARLAVLAHQRVFSAAWRIFLTTMDEAWEDYRAAEAADMEIRRANLSS